MANPVSFKIPSSPATQIYENERFLGADFTSDSANVDDTKSPNTINMIRSVPGKVRKRMGYSLYKKYSSQIYGAHYLKVTDEWIIHSGTSLYKIGSDTAIYTGVSDHRSVSFQLNQKLVILDGTKALIYDGTSVKPLSEDSYIPTLTIAKDYTGGGTDYEALNLLNPAFKETFLVKSTQADVKTFQLTFGGLDATAVKAWLLTSSATWTEKTEGTDFTVNRTTGAVTFTTAPGASPVTGEDNVKIQAYRTVSGYADRINHCTIGAMFGINGANDRLFLSGNSDHGTGTDGKLYSYINYDWFSEQYDPTYFADTSYSKLGSDSSAIMGYSIINNYLAAHKDSNELTQSILLREGDLVDSKPTFKLINTLQGAGAISKYCFSYLETEPLFLTKLGIYAVTAQDITGEKYAQDRSYYVDGKLLKEDGLENAFAYTYKDLYLLCINSHVYILDGLQPMQTDKSKPYATRQYAGFYWTNIPATCMWEINDALYFGSSDGSIFKFYEDDESITSYSDNGTAIESIWETADISGKLFYKNKTFRYIALRCTPAVVSSVQIWAQKYGLWEMIREESSKMRYFSYAHLVYSKLTYSGDYTQKVVSTKCRLKKLDKVRFRFINSNLEEPFGLNNFALEYTQNGNHK